MNEKILSVNDLKKHYGGVKAVDGLSFSVNEKEIVGLIGPNGAGKTTVFNSLMSSVDKTDGSVQFKSHDITNWDTNKIVRNGLARVSQHSAPFNNMTVKENIWMGTLPNSVFGIKGGASDQELIDIAKMLEIDSLMDEYPPSLPHADRRRLEIAKAIATNPDMVLFDEPFAGLASSEVEKLSELLKEFQMEGITMIVIDHDMKGLMALVDRVIVMHNGQKLAEGSPSEIADNKQVKEVYLSGSGGGD